MSSHYLIWLLVISTTLSLATTFIISNTISYSVISDADRYIQIVKAEAPSIGALPLFQSADIFRTWTNFLIILAFGSLVYSSTNSWRLTILTLLGFSISILVYFSLLAQAIVVIIGLWLWAKINPFEMKHPIRNHFIYLFLAIFMFFTHKYGLFLAILIYVLCALDAYLKGKPKFNSWAKRFAIFSYSCTGIFMLIVFLPSPEAVSFFFPFILPISMGSLNIIWWYGLFGIGLFMLLKCENNTKELIFVSVCFFSVFINYIFVSQLQIDAWRIILIGDLIALLKIGQNKTNSEFIKWTPIFLILLFVERLFIGILI